MEIYLHRKLLEHTHLNSKSDIFVLFLLYSNINWILYDDSFFHGMFSFFRSLLLYLAMKTNLISLISTTVEFRIVFIA